MRAAIEEVCGDAPIVSLLSEELAERAISRRKADGHSTPGSLSPLLPYLDFGDSFELLMARRADLRERQRQALDNVGPHLERTIAIRNRVAHTRPMEIDDTAHLIDLCEALADADPPSWETVRATLERLKRDPSFVLGLTVTLPSDPETGPQHNLPIPDFDETGFYGRREEIRRIKRAIKGAYPVVSILGDGGVGKTSIALKIAYDLLEEPDSQFDAIVWVTAKATILTVNEIQRINGAIEDSLGLFTSAALQLGGDGATEDPVREVLSYLETFRILLILDNLETVLDGRLREFLLELPIGSKVMVTSRIGLGIENPVSLDPLTDDESLRLLRALARTRGVSQLSTMPADSLGVLAAKMSGHPAYIRWFVAGVQAGRRPEELVRDNELLLDFCMSNVFEFLSEEARTVLRSMQVLSGARNQAELAFLNECSSSQIQAALLELLTTNFVRMASRTVDDSLDTVYVLSEFGKQYLDKQHPVGSDERTWLIDRHNQLLELGARLVAASSSSPFASETVTVRGSGDIHVARLLRDAIRASAIDPAAALTNCREAQVLSPSYYEAWRVEALVRGADRDQAGACAAYERALELAPASPVLHYHFGRYLLREAGDPARGMEVLQSAARLEPESPKILSEIAWGHQLLGSFDAALASAFHVAQSRASSAAEVSESVRIVLTSTAQAMRLEGRRASAVDALELLEQAVEFLDQVEVDLLVGEFNDRIALLTLLTAQIRPTLDEFLQSKARLYESRLVERRRRVDPSDTERQIGKVKSLVSDKGYGFLRLQGTDYFCHVREFLEPTEWDTLEEGVYCAFIPNPEEPRGPRALRIRALK